MIEALDVGSVKLLNDLEATAYGLPFLPPEDVYMLNNQQPDPHANKVIIAPGTGLGEAVLFAHEGKYIASASEGGHVDYAPHNLFQLELLRYMMGKFEHVSYERVCSGIGIPHIYDFLRTQSYMHPNPHVAAQLETVEDRTPVISKAALNLDCEVCVETLNVFVSILGAEAGNMALNVLARGGVYLGGGIPPRIVEKLKDGMFMAAFINKGRFADMLSKIPVYVILNDKTALFGAACYALGL
jgi:glucokinase